MRIAFLGDLHGHVLEALALVLRWQRLHGQLDLVVQVGDFGVPSPEGGIYEQLDPGQLDLMRVLHAEGALADALRWACTQLGAPILFIRGNHENEDWLDAIASGPVDPFDLFHYVQDGTVLCIDGVTLAFCGGSNDEGYADPRPEWPVGRHGVRAEPVERLLRSDTRVDVLVTHDTHYGVGRGYHGDVQGSRRVALLRDALKPRWHVSGHLHHVIGPVQLGTTRWVQLNLLFVGSRWTPAEPGIAPGAMGVLDTATWTFALVDEPWLADIGGFGTQFDFVATMSKLGWSG